MYDAYICVPQTLTLMLVCMMHISMILDSCMYEARMVHASTYDAIFFGNGHTFNGRSSSSSRSEQGYYGVGIMINAEENKRVSPLQVFLGNCQGQSS